MHFYQSTWPTFSFATHLLSSLKQSIRMMPPVVITLKLVQVVSYQEMALTLAQNLQSTNWQTLRFKPPPPNSSIGWRVEFRSMEVQLTDFENAAFSIFTVLLSRAILYFNLNFYVPISKVRYSD